MKAEKTLLIDDLLRRVNASPFLLVVDYTGLKVDKFAELRKRLSGVGAEIHVFKNNLVKKAGEKAGYPEELGSHLTGQSAYVTGVKDICATAKILKSTPSWTRSLCRATGTAPAAILIFPPKK